jgi:FlaA1/EpsC-like NDP-sugar epimerase
VQRYFTTMVKAVGALFQALQHSSSPALLLPDIGPAMRVVDLAKHLIESHSSDAALGFTGLRPGDKLAEQLVSEREVIFPRAEADRSTLRTIETPLVSAGALITALETLREAFHKRELKLLLRGVAALVPEYQPSSVITAALNEEAALELASELRA